LIGIFKKVHESYIEAKKHAEISHKHDEELEEFFKGDSWLPIDSERHESVGIRYAELMKKGLPKTFPKETYTFFQCDEFDEVDLSVALGKVYEHNWKPKLSIFEKGIIHTNPMRKI